MGSSIGATLFFILWVAGAVQFVWLFFLLHGIRAALRANYSEIDDELSRSWVQGSEGFYGTLKFVKSRRWESMDDQGLQQQCRRAHRLFNGAMLAVAAGVLVGIASDFK